MSVQNGQNANAKTFNDAFVSKTSDSEVTAKINLKNPSSGNDVINVQQEINNLKSDSVQHGQDIIQNTDDIQQNTADILNVYGAVGALFGGIMCRVYKFKGEDIKQKTLLDTKKARAIFPLDKKMIFAGATVQIVDEITSANSMSSFKVSVGNVDLDDNGEDDYFLEAKELFGSPDNKMAETAFTFDPMKYDDEANGFSVFVEADDDISDIDDESLFEVRVYVLNLGAGQEIPWRP